MDITIDPNVKAVAEFMQERLPAAQLVAVANAIAAIAPLLWGEYQADRISPLRLANPPILADGPHTLPVSSE